MNLNSEELVIIILFVLVIVTPFAITLRRIIIIWTKLISKDNKIAQKSNICYLVDSN